MPTPAGGNSLIVRGLDYASPSAWQAIFNNHAPEMGGFEGNVDNASFLMATFGQGRDCIRNFFAGKVEVSYPDIWIMYEDAAMPTPPLFHYTSQDKSTRAVVAKKSFIQALSCFGIDEVRTFTRMNDGKQFRMTPSDYFFLGGVEETHHSVYVQLHPDKNDQEQRAKAGTRAEYHALENEWQALAFQIKFATERRLTSFVVRDLLKTQRGAAKVRHKQGLPTDSIPFLD